MKQFEKIRLCALMLFENSELYTDIFDGNNPPRFHHRDAGTSPVRHRAASGDKLGSSTSAKASVFDLDLPKNPDSFVGILSGFPFDSSPRSRIPTWLSGRCRLLRSWSGGSVLRGAPFAGPVDQSFVHQLSQYPL